MKTLAISLEKVDFLPPTRVTDDTSVLTLKNLVFEPLLKWADGFVHPALFDGWTHSPDGREWRFTIRKGAVFHDGKPCVADDVLAFIDGILEAVDTFGMKWSYARYLRDARITAEANDVVRVENPEPIADILDIFSEFYLCRFDAAGRPILGTGRYRVMEFEPLKHAVLERVRDEPSPLIITVLAEKSADLRYDQLKGGLVDAALNLERVEGRLAFDDAFQWGKAVNTLSVMYYLNCNEGIFRSANARLAVNHAVDTVAMAQQIFHGLAVPSSSIVSPFHLGMAKADLTPIAYDPEKAKRLLDGVETGGRIRLRTPTCMPERAPEMSRFVAEALEAVGLAVDIETEPDRPEYARQIGRKDMGDMAIFDSSPHSTYRILNDKISSETKAVWWQGYDDAETETLIKTANRAVSDAEREATYARCLTRLHRAPPWLYLVHPVDVFAARKGIGGLWIDHKGTLNIR
ncbi:MULTISPECIES: ABC transporter substrate-binding protein [unclassified Rhizobium]|uniref:ABC transporter substrate-binding protein n=1 Tax=unclassified Rhizobium TaxID=2613769 RepID=UPI00247A9670|nr:MULTISPECIES: ABC transporter substrate-binding protein [unclassified Rhizobium]MDH7800774.1 peptide/nickel transport system substrate-binding protein [Rhizobium sp. AN70]